MRTATITRSTAETAIDVTVNLDGTGVYDVETGVGFFDHMLEQLSRHSLIDIRVRTKGDLHIDEHQPSRIPASRSARRSRRRSAINAASRGTAMRCRRWTRR